MIHIKDKKKCDCQSDSGIDVYLDEEDGNYYCLFCNNVVNTTINTNQAAISKTNEDYNKDYNTITSKNTKRKK